MKTDPLPRSPAAACTLLALDSATEQLALAVHAGGQALSLNAAGGALASATLLPQAQALLARAGRSLADVGLVAYGCGPGAFTGLRTACAVAQGVALGAAGGRGCPVLAIDSLLIVAEDARNQALQAGPGPAGDMPWTVAVAMDARMNEVYAAVYRWADGGWTAQQPPGLYGVDAWTAAWSGLRVDALAGSALTAFAGRGPLSAGRVAAPAAAALPWPFEHDRAGALLRLALRAAAAGAGVDAAQALPHYLRDRVALTSAERQAAKTAATSAPAGTAEGL